MHTFLGGFLRETSGVLCWRLLGDFCKRFRQEFLLETCSFLRPVFVGHFCGRFLHAFLLETYGELLQENLTGVFAGYFCSFFSWRLEGDACRFLREILQEILPRDLWKTFARLFAGDLRQTFAEEIARELWETCGSLRDFCCRLVEDFWWFLLETCGDIFKKGFARFLLETFAGSF